jgi:hypothetical protein
MAALAGFVFGGLGMSDSRVGVILALAIAAVAAFGYTCGRRAGPTVIALDPAIARLLAPRQGDGA